MNTIPKAILTEGMVVTRKHPKAGCFEEAPPEENRIAWRIVSISLGQFKKERVVCRKSSFIACPDRTRYEPMSHKFFLLF